MGQVVLLREGEEVPADVVILRTSGVQGLQRCFTETSSIDGASANHKGHEWCRMLPKPYDPSGVLLDHQLRVQQCAAA